GDADAGELVQKLVPVAVDDSGGQGGSGFRILEDGIDGFGGENAGEKRANGSARSVYAERVEGIVIAEPAFDLDDHEIAEDSGDGSYDERGHGLDEAGGGGDGDESGDGSGDCAQGGRLAAMNPLGGGPGEGGGGGGEVGVNKGAGGQRAGA